MDLIIFYMIKKCVDLLQITDENKSHYVCMKDFNRFMFDKSKKTLQQILFTMF